MGDIETMSTEKTGVYDGPKALSIFGLAAAAVLGFTLQPLTAIADPIALSITGVLLVTTVFLFTGSLTVDLSTKQVLMFEIVATAAIISMVITGGDAWLEQRSVKTTCGRLQRIMLYEHRKRGDIPQIFRVLGCRIQG